jgi:hypothetical protein
MQDFHAFWLQTYGGLENVTLFKDKWMTPEVIIALTLAQATKTKED